MKNSIHSQVLTQEARARLKQCSFKWHKQDSSVEELVKMSLSDYWKKYLG